MGKKHFIALAKHIQEHQSYSSQPFTYEQLTSLANFCQSQNAAFDRARWLMFIRGECGPNGGQRR